MTKESASLRIATIAIMLICQKAGAQLSYSSGQSVYPAYEGWAQNADGSYRMLFGYTQNTNPLRRG
jgi:hypothetical protein